MIWNKNAIWVGALVGLVVPFVGYAVLLTIFDGLDRMGITDQIGLAENFRSRTLSLVAICLNVFVMNYYNRLRHTQSMRGVVIAVLISAGVWLYLYGSYLISWL